MSEQVIIARDIRQRYGAVKALNGISLSVNKGDVQFLIGPSGCGKSTFLRCLNLLDIPKEGSLDIVGQQFAFQENAVPPPPVRLNALRAQVGMVFQQFHLFPHMTALQNVMEGLVTVQRIPAARAHELAMVEIEKVGLADKARTRPHELSGGQAQRIAIARALAMKPKVMLFDEPTSALDPELVGEVLDVVAQLATEGMTMVIVTHEMAFAREIGTRVMFIEHGVCVEQGEPNEVFGNPRAARLGTFLSRVRMH